MPSLAMRIMEDTASTAEQQYYAQRLISAGERLRQRAAGTTGAVIEGDIVTLDPPVLPSVRSPNDKMDPEPDRTQ